MPEFAKEYVDATGSVLRAGRRLRNYLGTDPSRIEFAVSQLEAAAQEHSNRSAGYQKFMFEQLATAQPQAAPVTEDLLASVLTEIQTANVLMAAGQALGETGQKADATLLDDALTHLESVRDGMERAQSSPAPGRFGFTGESAPAMAAPGDAAAARARFGELAEGTLHSLVSDAQGVVTTLVEALDKVGAQKCVEALAWLGQEIGAVKGIGRLFSQGVAKLRSALDALVRMMGSNALEAVKGYAEKVWKDIKQGKLAGSVLEWAFGVEATRQLVKSTLALEGLDPDALARALQDLPLLRSRFQESMALTRRLAKGVGIAAGVLAFTPIAAQGAALAAAAYALILAAVVLLGMDYADSGGILRSVRGVGTIVASVAPVAAK